MLSPPQLSEVFVGLSAYSIYQVCFSSNADNKSTAVSIDYDHHHYYWCLHLQYILIKGKVHGFDPQRACVS